MLTREAIDEELRETRHSESTTAAAIKPFEVKEIPMGEPIEPKPIKKPTEVPAKEEKEEKKLGELV